jgi:Tfp pilus assembly protein PilF
VTRVFRQVSDSVSGAFDLQPETIPANDPTRLSSSPNQLTPRVYVRAAAWAEDQKAPHIARGQYEKALSLDPNDPQTLIAFARFEDRQGNAGEASQLYERALNAAPRNAIVLNDMGIFYARRREFASSLNYLEQAVQIAPDNVRYRNNLAGVLVQTRRPEDAVAVLQSVHADAVARMNVGHFLYMEKEYTQAASYFRQANQLDPSLVAAREMLSRIEGSDSQFQQTTPYTAPTTPNRPDSSPYQFGSHPNEPAQESRSWYTPEMPLTSGVYRHTESPAGQARRLPPVN